MSRTVSEVLAAAMAFALVTVPTANADDDSQTVRTDKGLVSGTVTSTYRTFGAIPFAAPPVRANRWRDPQPVTPWQGVRDGTLPSPACAQPGRSRVAGVELSAGQRELSDYLVTAWGRFARTGDPGWRADVQSLAAGAIRPVKDFAKDHHCDFWGGRGA